MHRVQEVSGKQRHTSYVSVSIVDHSQSTRTVLRKDVQFREYIGGGAGGQHRNKNSTCVRATHLPTGITTTAEDSKSQYINKETAFNKIVELVAEQDRVNAAIKQNTERIEQISKVSWQWNGWRDRVDIPGHGTFSMSKILKGRFPF